MYYYLTGLSREYVLYCFRCFRGLYMYQYYYSYVVTIKDIDNAKQNYYDLQNLYGNKMALDAEEFDEVGGIQ